MFGSGFGGFGQPQSSSSSSGLFGGFGQTATPAAAAPLFGAAPAPANTSSGLFGGTSTGFGSSPTPSAGGLFGQPAQATTSFGGFSQPAQPAQPVMGSTLFGSQPQQSLQPTGFGASTGFGAASASPFGATQPAATSAFGQPAQPAATGFSGFGAPAQPTSAFGASSAPFGATSTGFGQPAASPFGAATTTSTSGFGGGGFGGFGGGTLGSGQGTTGQKFQAVVEEGGIGTKMKYASITAMEAYKGKSLEELRFEDYKQGKGASAVPSALPGLSAPAPAGGMFGQAAHPFGQPQQPAASTGMFGQPAAAPAFGQPAQPAPAFGGGGLFGAAQPAAAAPAGGLFGAPAQSSGLFGAPAPASSSAGFSGFGAPASQAGGLFSGFGATPAAAPASSSSSLFGPTPAASGSSLFGTAAPASSSASGGLFGGGLGGGLFGATATPAAPAPAFGGSSLFQSQPAATSASTGLGSLFGPQPTATSSLFAPQQPAAQPAQPLLPSVAPVSLPAPPKPAGLILPRPVERSMAAFLWKPEPASFATAPLPRILSGRKSGTVAPALPSPPSPTGSVIRAAVEWGASAVESATLRRLTIAPAKSRSASPTGSPRRVVAALPADEVEQPRILTFAQVAPAAIPLAVAEHPKYAPREMLPRLSNPSMFMRPSTDALALLSESELARVDHFQVGCFGKGLVTWPGLSDLRYLDVDAVVRFEERAVVVYPDEEGKPVEGEGLNKPAVIELKLEPKNVAKARTNEAAYIDKIRELTSNMGAEFLSYDLETWRFRVAHFSRWGIPDSEWNDLEDTGMVVAVVEDEAPRKFFGTGEWAELEKQQGVEDNQIMAVEPVQTPLMIEDVDARFIPFPAPTYQEIIDQGWSMRHGDSFLCLTCRPAFSNDALFYPIDSRVDVVALKDVIGTQTTPKETVKALLDVMQGFRADGRISAARQEVELGSLEWRICEFAVARRNFHAISRNQVMREWLAAVCLQAVESRFARSALHWLCAGQFERAAEILVNQGYSSLALLAAAGPTEGNRALLKRQDTTRMSPEERDVFRVLAGDVPAIGDWRLETYARILYGDLSPAAALPAHAEGFDFSLAQKYLAEDDSPLLIPREVFLSWFSAALASDHPAPVLTLACADYLEISSGLNWQYAAVPLATLPAPAAPMQALALRHAPLLTVREKSDVHSFIAGNFSILLRSGLSEKFLVHALEIRNK